MRVESCGHGRSTAFSTRCAALLVALLPVGLGGCERNATPQPLDGGRPLAWEMSAADETLLRDPCWRRERGGWHLSAGHCSEMLPTRKMKGVWVTGFEESSFLPGATAMPDRNDKRRYMIELEIDEDRVADMVGHRFDGREYHAIALDLIARRTKYPTSIDCYGGRSFSFVAYRINRARYLGTIANPDPPPHPAKLPPYKPFARSGEGGVIGRMEAEALARCGTRFS